MKKLLLSVLVALFAVTAFSQTASEIEIMQRSFALDKMQIVAAYVSPSEEHIAPFIDVYEEYELKRMELGKERIALLNEYAENWDGMTNEQAEAWMKKVLDLRKKTDKLIDTYYTKVKKATDAKTATQFYQVELYILTTVRYALFETIPFVGEK
ncbi:MAG: hypothetical protein GQ527_00720 [Bacteroidales bacterium]|nr:hypothetical protein [Bacteroidales bacterium]